MSGCILPVKCILNVFYLWRLIIPEGYGNHVNAPGEAFGGVVFCKISLGRSNELLPFRRCDAGKGAFRCWGTACADFYEGQQIIFLSDNVNFAILAVPILGSDVIVTLLEVLGCECFTVSTRLFLRCRHEVSAISIFMVKVNYRLIVCEWGVVLEKIAVLSASLPDNGTTDKFRFTALAVNTF